MLTQDQKSKYLASPHRCPYCGSDELSLGKAAAEINRTVQSILCRQCKKRWTNIYTLMQLEEDKWHMKMREIRSGYHLKQRRGILLVDRDRIHRLGEPIFVINVLPGSLK